MKQMSTRTVSQTVSPCHVLDGTLVPQSLSMHGEAQDGDRQQPLIPHAPYFARSLARKTAGPAISKGSPSLPKGIRADMYCRFSAFARSSWLMGVSMVPGRTELQRMLCLPSATAQLSIRDCFREWGGEGEGDRGWRQMCVVHGSCSGSEQE